MASIINIYGAKPRRMKSFFLTVLWAIVTALLFPGLYVPLSAQVEWTLDDVITLAEEKSIFRYQADANREIAHSQFRFFKTNFNPIARLDLLAPNFSKTSRETIQPDGTIAFQSVSQNNSSINLGVEQQIMATGGTVFLSSQLQRFDDFSANSKQFNGVPFRIGMNQPLFGFNGLKWANKIEPLALQEADRQYVINMEDIHLQGTIAFFDLLSALVEQQIAKTNSDVNNTLLDIANERFTLGKISRSDLLQLELEYRSAVKDYSAATFQVEFAQSVLLNFLGGFHKQDVQLVAPAPTTDEIIVPAASAMAYARENRPEILSFERRKHEADRDINSASVEYGIQANLFASFGFARGSDKIGDIYSDPITEQQVQLSVSIPILDWGRKKSAVGIAKARKELVLQQIAQDELDFENDILQAISNWEQLQREVQLQEEIREVSLERFEISRERYVLGDISITDLTIAQREKDQAQRIYIETLRSYWIAYYQIRKLTAYDFQTDSPIQYLLN